MLRSRRFFLSLGCLLLLCGTSARAERTIGPPTFSPTGDVTDVRQVTARFAEPMVPLGDPRVIEKPFDVNCPAQGTPRWVDSRTWTFDFESTLPGGLECHFTLLNGLRTLAGNSVRGGKKFSFSTGGPRIVSTDPYRGSTVAEDAAFLLRLDAETVPESVEEHAYFAVSGIGERVGVRLIRGDDRGAILRTLPEQSRTGPIVVLQARQAFPPEAKIELVWAKGIEATTGLARAKDQKVAFQARKAFHATFTCQREKAQGPCVPLGQVRIRFSEPVSWEVAQTATLVDPASDFTAQAERWLGDGASTSGIRFSEHLPPGTTLELRLPDDLRDEGGRALENAAQFPLSVETGPYPPLAKFAARFGLLEANASPALPVTVRSLGPELHGQILATTKTLDGKVARVGADDVDDVLPWLRRIRAARRDRSVFPPADKKDEASSERRKLALPIPGKPDETEVLGIPLSKPGLYVVEIESKPLGRVLLGKPKPMYVSAAALVTNLAVHLKHGIEGSLVWVTTLDQGAPAAETEIRAYDCTGKVLATGTTDANGIARLDALPAPDDIASCSVQNEDWSDPWRGWRGNNQALDGIDHGVFVTARRGEDLSFVFSAWDDGIEPWRFGIYSFAWGRPAGLHTVFGRTLLRAGDTVHMKHIVRMETGDGFALAKPDALPGLVSIRHVGSDAKVELPIEWTADGSALTTWAIPPSAKLGEYDVFLEHPPPTEEETSKAAPGGEEEEDGDLRVYDPGPPELRGQSGSFRVEEFRVPLMHAVVKLPPESQVGVPVVPVDIALRYLAGGGAGNTAVLLRSQISPGSIDAPAVFEGLTFGNGPVEPGIDRQPTYQRNEPTAPKIHERQEVELDAEGTARAWITNLPQGGRPRQLTAEVEYRDPNGETQTTAASVALWPAAHAIGLKVDDWVGSTGRIVIETAVIDPAGVPVSGAAVEVKAFTRRNFTSRKRVVGGFYSYESVEETTFAHTVCSGQTDKNGRLACRRRPPAKGELVIQASTTDSEGRVSTTHQSVWISGEEDQWFRPSDTDRMELIPEKHRYEPGETARLQVRMPFPRALALVTVEREGVIEASVETLEGIDPVIELPISGRLAPNAYVSVLAVRGRVTEPQPTALVDLGKPAYRLGLAEIEVGWRTHELDVAVTADRSVYKVRENAEVTVEVRDKSGNAPPAGSEIAIAAVDAGLLDLVPNRSWNLLRAMMGDRPESVSTSTAQMQVVGKRHFGRKAIPQGGGGGRKPTRELFDTLLVWKGRVALDENGDAKVSIPLNDSLTSFRIVAIATGGAGRFGTGRTTIQATQELMIFSGLPPVVRGGDSLWSEFTVRNTTNRTIDVQLTVRADGLGATLPPLDVRLAAGEARALGWHTQVPHEIDRLEWEVQARDTHGEATDRLRVSQKVKPAVPVQTLQASLEQWAPPGPTMLPVARPADALTDKGGVVVALAGSLADGLAGVRGWMRDYPYTCLEQQVSRAIVLDDDAQWSTIIQGLSSYVDREGLLKFFPTMDRGSPVLTAYVLEIAHLAERPLPSDLQERMESALIRFIQGKTAHTDASGGALGLRKLAVLSTLAQVGRARPELLESLTIEPELWPTTSVLDWWNVLRALPDLPGRKQKLAAVEKIVRARVFEQGTTLSLSTGSAESAWWLLANEDTDALRLVLLLLQADVWRDDLPRLMRGAIGLQEKGAWSTTVANAWGALAVARFSREFEPEPVDGTTVAALAGHAQQIDWIRHPEGESLSFAWPATASELSVQHQGHGRPWILTRTRAAVPLTEPSGSGFWIRRTVTPAQPRADGTLRVGDILTVKLEVEAASGHGWVVVEDPVPAGVSFLGRGFDTDSKLVEADDSSGDAVPAFVERSFEGYRAYYERILPGKFALEYRIRLNQAGDFHSPPTRVEAMYSPEAYAELPQALVHVER
ncbi:MAG: MG2 domain-containing protein [Candidatus Binatia bacterium]|nr:MG2 domain-containing protein [Candidatus Binatia bacterium]